MIFLSLHDGILEPAIAALGDLLSLILTGFPGRFICGTKLFSDRNVKGRCVYIIY